jgi:hypothetical protein
MARSFSQPALPARGVSNKDDTMARWHQMTPKVLIEIRQQTQKFEKLKTYE